jgi:alkanesulfonate monooxygenase SsuD/methylene tetrahydromethanopterin reductase-like flavin-dependent oxidoreductase (luciferase family)
MTTAMAMRLGAFLMPAHPPDRAVPLYLSLGLGSLLKNDPAMPDKDICLDYVADNLRLTGSPNTVAGRLTELYQQTGGFGYLLITCYDAAGEQQVWERSLRLLMEQVLPACRRACMGAVPRAEEAA